MNVYALSGLINGLTATALGIFVYSRAPGDLRHRTYSLFCSGVAVWSYFYCAWHLTESQDLALAFVRLLMVGAILLPVFYLHHVLALLDAITRHRRLLQAGYLASGLFILSDLTSWFVAGVGPKMSFPNWPTPGPVFHVYLAAFAAYAGYSIYLLAQAYRKGTGLQRNQYLYLLAATLIGYGGGATNFPLWYGIQIPPNWTILVTVYTIMVAYAIVRFRLMDITVVIHKGLARGVLLAAIMVPVYLALTVSQRATVHSIPPLVVGSLVLASGLWIALKNPRSPINLTFGLVCVGVFTWLFSFFMIYSTPDEAKAFFWGKMIYAGVVYIPAFFYHFCLSLVESQARTKLIVGNYLIGTAFLLLLPTPLLVNGHYSYFWGYYPKAGAAHPVFLLYFAVIGGLSLYKLYLGYKAKEDSSPLEAIRIKYVFWAFVLGYAASLDFLQSYGIEFYPLGFIFVSLWVLLVTYAIVRYQILNISLMVSTTKVLPIAQTLALLLVSYAGILGLIRIFTGSTYHLLAGVLLATAVMLAELLGTVLKRTERIVGQPMKVGSSLPHYLLCAQSILIREELEEVGDPGTPRPLLHQLKTLDAEVCIPLINKERLIGFCNLGPRARRQMYSDEDLGLLTTMGQNAAIALDNATLYQDLKRSEVLMRRTDRLRSLETIAGGFAHEIRNPLTSIKTFVQLAPERTNDPEFMGQFSKTVCDDVDRIERLIQEILDYARYMEPKFMEEDFNEIVASCLYFIEVKADSKSITIEKDLTSDLPRVMVDRQQIKQVLLNLLLNALQAMPDSGGRLTVKTHRLTKSLDSWVQVEVGDTGHGIPADDLDHIFDPFFTTKHESVEREGTGLGLTIVHQIVQEHHGYIEVHSTVGSGTTFYVNLPVTPLRRAPSSRHEEYEKTSPIGR
ncbi:MAG: hypothetical protein E6K61_02585 [Nitrospirae bacterium]|nr:MAG: hypothetical protein E6K61_02585 [Nitrospirota bacterium]